MTISTQIEKVRDAMNNFDVDDVRKKLGEIDKQLNGSGDE